MIDIFEASATGTLWGAIVERGRAALATGALHPIATETRTIDDHGVRFQVRIVSSLARKLVQGLARWHAPPASGEAAVDPFLPYEKDMFVADVSDTHVCLLNKYNVIDHHALVVTRGFEHQQSPLTRTDFEALWSCMAEFRALAFYNSGPVAGASQPHKHMQLVPLPLSAESQELPISILLEAAPRASAPVRVPGLPFVHAFSWLDAIPISTAGDLHALYQSMLAATGIDSAAPTPAPYNLLLTRRFMLVIPRRVLYFDTVAVNALGFAGSFFVANQSGLAAIERAGPMEILTQVCFSD